MFKTCDKCGRKMSPAGAFIFSFVSPTGDEERLLLCEKCYNDFLSDIYYKEGSFVEVEAAEVITDEDL